MRLYHSGLYAWIIHVGPFSFGLHIVHNSGMMTKLCVIKVETNINISYVCIVRKKVI